MEPIVTHSDNENEDSPVPVDTQFLFKSAVSMDYSDTSLDYGTDSFLSKMGIPDEPCLEDIQSSKHSDFHILNPILRMDAVFVDS